MPPWASDDGELVCPAAAVS